MSNPNSQLVTQNPNLEKWKTPTPTTPTNPAQDAPNFAPDRKKKTWAESTRLAVHVQLRREDAAPPQRRQGPAEAPDAREELHEAERRRKLRRAEFGSRGGKNLNSSIC